MFEVRKDLAWDLSSSKYVFQVASQNVERDVVALVEWLNTDEKVQRIMLQPQSRDSIGEIKALIDVHPHLGRVLIFPMMLGLIA